MKLKYITQPGKVVHYRYNNRFDRTLCGAKITAKMRDVNSKASKRLCGRCERMVADIPMGVLGSSLA